MLRYTLFYCLVIAIVGQLYQKVVHNTDPSATCLDGSPSLLYVHQGSIKNKFLIYFVGGGSCGSDSLSNTLESCYQRSKTFFGTSKLWPQTIQGQGYLSTNPDNNKFAEWTKVIFGYCDGALHQGFAKEPLAYKGVQLFFRGSLITRAHFKWLDDTYGLYKADQIILTGGSAGGIATFLWTNYLQSKIANPNQLSTIIDSGIFLDVETVDTKIPLIRLQLSNLYRIANEDQSTPLSQCNILYPQMQWKCFFFENIYQLIKGSILVIQSDYDSYTIPNILKIDCLKDAKTGGYTLSDCNSTQMQAIQDYKEKYLAIALSFIKTSSNKSIWSIGCSNHVYAIYNEFYDSASQKVPQNQGYTIKNVVQRFVINKEQIIRVDAENWPNNRPCSF